MTRPFLTHHERNALTQTLSIALGALLGVAALLLFIALLTHSHSDPTGLNATTLRPQNALGFGGAEVSAHLFAWLGYGAFAVALIFGVWSAWLLIGPRRPEQIFHRIALAPVAVLALSAFASAHIGQISTGVGLGGLFGDFVLRLVVDLLWFESRNLRLMVGTLLLGPAALAALLFAIGGRGRDLVRILNRMFRAMRSVATLSAERQSPIRQSRVVDPPFRDYPAFEEYDPYAENARRRPPPAPEDYSYSEDYSYADPQPLASRFHARRARADYYEAAEAPDYDEPSYDEAARYNDEPDREDPQALELEPSLSAPRRERPHFEASGFDDAPFDEARRELHPLPPEPAADATALPAEPHPVESRDPSSFRAPRRRLNPRFLPVAPRSARASDGGARADKALERFVQLGDGGSDAVPREAPETARTTLNGMRNQKLVPAPALGPETIDAPRHTAPRRSDHVAQFLKDAVASDAQRAEEDADTSWRDTVIAPRLAAAPKRSDSWTIGRATIGYAPPAVDLMDKSARSTPDPALERRLAEKAERLQRVLNEYGVRGDIIHVTPGPVVSQFELEPGPGVKVSRVTALADDIARAMSAVSARIAPIPGKHVIAVELPNSERKMVRLRDLLEDPSFITHPGALPIALGVDHTGGSKIVDLARAPHLLIAGATGSGKSVAVNSILMSLLYRMNPTELRLLLIDPKQLELAAYNGGPHLLSPVVTESKTAVQALKWTIREMERRYALMSQLGVRGLEGYNKRAEELRRSGGVFEVESEIGVDPASGAPINGSERIAPDPLARIVVIIDEIAELMMVAGKEIEHCVLRLAQMGRACGIHIVAATQRPSVDVITGLIKANFPTRISLQTVSAADSKTILDRPGAEKLLGRGDMLYAPGGAQLERVHGAFVSDAEVAAVAEHLERQGPPADQVHFDMSESASLEESAEFDAEEGEDPFYERAIQIIVAENRASASFLQRRLSIGYNRASRLIEQMERDGVVSPLTAAGKREVLAPQDAAVAAK